MGVNLATIPPKNASNALNLYYSLRFMKVLFSQKSKRLSWILAVLFFTSAQSASATNYYVSKSGNDANSGLSLALAKLTITAAANTASSGDVIYISTGYYAEVVSLGKSMTFMVDSVQVNELSMATSGITLTIDGNANEKTFNIKTKLTLTDGIVKIGSSLNAFRALDGCTVGAGTKTSYVDGAVHIGLTNGSTSMTFPLGTGSDYRPVSISFSKSNGNLTYFWFHAKSGSAAGNGSLPTGIRNYSSVNHFVGGTVPALASNASNFTVTLRYDSVSTDDGVYETSTLRILGYTPTTTWANLGGTGSVVRKGQIQTSSISTLGGTFALACAFKTLTANERMTGVNLLGDLEPHASYKLTGKCSADSFRFTDLTRSKSAILSYKWNFGEAGSTSNTASTRNATHKYANSGTYRVSFVTLNADNFLDSWVQLVTVFASPFILKTVNNVCIGEQTTMTDFSQANGETISGWNWNLGDGPPATIKTSKSITHIYTNPGGYKVLLKVTTINGCSSIDTFDYVVHDKPTPTFDPKDVCFGQSVLFDDQSTVAAPDLIASRKWDLGDGFTSTSKTLSRKYAAPGIYNVKLISYSNYLGQKGACRDSITKPVRVYALPDVSYTQSHTCFEEETVFTDNTVIMNPDYAATYTWTFGDGGTDTTMYGARYTYAAAGAYKTRLTVVSNAGCIGTDTLTVYVHPKPKAGYTVKEVCFGDSTAFTRVGQISPTLESKMTYSWLFDGTIAYFTKTPKIMFAAPGAHTVVLLAKTNEGCMDSAVGSVRSFYMPNPQFTLDNTITPNDSIQCFKNNLFTFNFSVSIDPNDTLLNSAWNWGDKQTEMPATNSTHSFLDTGVYTVKLYGWSINGCADSMVKQYVVKPSPVAKFYHEGTCVPDTIRFYDTASVSARPIAIRKWKFGAGTVFGAAPKSNYYTTSGPHDVTYIIENDLGCADSLTQTFNFIVKPVISFNYTGSMPLCKGDSIDITAGGADSIQWIASGDTNRTQKFFGRGWYKVKGTTGICSTIDSVQVLAFPTANIVVHSDTTIYRGKRATLWATGAKNYWWTDSSTLSIGNGDSVIARPLVTKVYYVSGTDSNGCDDLDSVLVTVVDPPLVKIPNLITPNGDNENDFWDLTELADLFLFDIRISDRQGKLVYNTNNYQNDWAAVDNQGLDLPPGIYFYYMKNRFNGEELRGYIQVIR
jgi:gliding motility-associated-like protein